MPSSAWAGLAETPSTWPRRQTFESMPPAKFFTKVKSPVHTISRVEIAVRIEYAIGSNLFSLQRTDTLKKGGAMKRPLILSFACLTVVALLCWQSSVALAKHGHGDGHKHGGGHGHGDGHKHGGDRDHGGGHERGGHHSGEHEFRGGHGRSYGHGHVEHHFAAPHLSHHYYGRYWVDSGLTYYKPRTFADSPDAYVESKPIAIEFGGFSHVDELSGHLEHLANDLCLDMHYNYSHNAGFPETYREAYQFLEASKSVHAKEDKIDRAELGRQIQELDRTFHHVQGKVRGWSRQHRRQIGQAGILTKMDVTEALLHHLMVDVGIKPHSAEATEAAPAPATLEVAPPPTTESSSPSPTIP